MTPANPRLRPRVGLFSLGRFSDGLSQNPRFSPPRRRVPRVGEHVPRDTHRRSRGIGFSRVHHGGDAGARRESDSLRVGRPGKRLRVGKRTLGVLAVSRRSSLARRQRSCLVGRAPRGIRLLGAPHRALPLWVTIMESIIDRRAPTWRLVAALLVGLAGVAVLNGPVILGGSNQDIYAAVALVAAAMSWGIGVIYQKRKALALDAEAELGLPATRRRLWPLSRRACDRRTAPRSHSRSLGGVGVSRHFRGRDRVRLPHQGAPAAPDEHRHDVRVREPRRRGDFLRLVLGEPITAWTVGGTVLIVLGVMGVFHERRTAPGREHFGKRGRPSDALRTVWTKQPIDVIN